MCRVNIMKNVFYILLMFIVLTPNAGASELPKACAPSGTTDQESFIFAWVAETTRKGSQEQIKATNECLWNLWPSRDGAFVRVLVDNFLYLADRDVGTFLLAIPNSNDFTSLCKDLQSKGFVARSNSEFRYLVNLRKSLRTKITAFTKLSRDKTMLLRAEELQKALTAADLREIQ
jgi:hypothetical protein